jgi:signal peptidase II
MESDAMTAPASFLRFFLAAVILSSCIGCDQATKRLATQALMNSPAQSFLAGTIRLEYAQNPGGFLSLGSNLPEGLRQSLFVVLNVGMMLAISGFLLLRRNIPFAFFVALSYVLAGGIGNLIDRVMNHGLVTDFINVGIGPLRTGIFNVADIAVTFGGIAAVVLAPRR